MIKKSNSRDDHCDNKLLSFCCLVLSLGIYVMCAYFYIMKSFVFTSF